MQTVTAIYEDGVFRPTQPVDLPERCQVEIEVRVPLEKGESENGKSSSADEPQFDPTAMALEDAIAEIMSSVPPEDWATLPEDLTDNLDHYLYGTPRDEKGVR